MITKFIKFIELTLSGITRNYRSQFACFKPSSFVPSRSKDGMPFHTQACKDTPMVFCKLSRPICNHLGCPEQEARFCTYGPFKDFFSKPRFDTVHLPTLFVGDKAVRDGLDKLVASLLRWVPVETGVKDLLALRLKLVSSHLEASGLKRRGQVLERIPKDRSPSIKTSSSSQPCHERLLHTSLKRPGALHKPKGMDALGHITRNVVPINDVMSVMAVSDEKDRAPPQVTQLSSTALTGAGAGAGAEAWFFLSKSNARTISLSSATSDETAWVEEFALTLATTA
ncbi:hypothetical protein Tco_1571538 [Tanacetum coccineum]